MPEPDDPRFALPFADGSASAEIGVILMGLDAERLLAGLGLATFADDPALVTLAVDQVRHGSMDRITAGGLVETGSRRWRSVRAEVAEANRGVSWSGSLRGSWDQTVRILTASVGEVGPASLAYLAACWLRREEVDSAVVPG